MPVRVHESPLPSDTSPDVEALRIQLFREMSAARKLELVVKSPEDTVLRKLAWYRLGREVSDRQWSDLLGILAVQGKDLDREHLQRWAPELGVEDLLDRLLTDD